MAKTYEAKIYQTVYFDDLSVGELFFHLGDATLDNLPGDDMPRELYTKVNRKTAKSAEKQIYNHFGVKSIVGLVRLEPT